MNKRQQSLLRLLIINEEYLTAKELAKKFNVSTKTIYNDIDFLNTEIQKISDTSTIEKIPRKGIKIETNHSERLQEIFLRMDRLSIDNKFNSDRTIELFQLIFIDGAVVNYEYMDEVLFVSESTIKRDFEKLKDAAQVFRISLLDQDGQINVQGEEISIRNFIRDYISSRIVLKTQAQVNDATDNFLTNLFGEEDLSFAKQITAQILEKYNFEFSLSEYYYGIILEILIIISRGRQGNQLRLYDNKIIKEISHLEVYFCAKDLFEMIQCEHQFLEKTDAELDALSFALLSAGFSVKENPMNDQVKIAVDKFIENVSVLMDINFRYDSHLKSMLENHIGPMILRLTNGVVIKNPMLGEIREQYNVLYSVMWFATSEMENMFNIHLTEEEIAFLVVHFQVALDKIENPLKILVVCPNGIATSELIISKLKKMVSSIDIIEKSKLAQITSENVSNLDLIISTVRLDQDISIPVKYVSPLITNKELLEIQDEYLALKDRSKSQTKQKLGNQKSNYYRFLLDELLQTSIYFETNFKSKEACLDYVINHSYDVNLEDNAFVDSVFSRESLGDTGTQFGVALPHANPDYVHKSQIVIVKTKQKLNWGRNQVNLIVFIAISSSDSVMLKDFLVEFLSLMASGSVVKELLESEKPSQLKIKLLNKL